MRWLAPLLLLASCQPPQDVAGLTGPAPEAPALAVRPPRSYRLSFTVTGSAAPETTVRLWPNARCDGLALLEVSPEALAAGVTLGAVPSSANVVAARAVSALGIASACSPSVTFEQLGRLVLPTPTLETLPPSPSGITTPLLRGRSPDGARVRLWAGAGCRGSPMAELSQALLDRGVPVEVQRDALTWWSAQAEDADGAVSACGDFAYRHDGRRPAPPQLAPPLPVTPSSDLGLWVNVLADRDACVQIFLQAHCEGPPAYGSCNERPALVPVPQGAETRYSARAVNGLQNESQCVELFGHTSDPALPPWLFDVRAVRAPDDPTAVLISGRAPYDAYALAWDGAACEGTPVGFSVNGVPDFALRVTGREPAAPWVGSVRAVRPDGIPGYYRSVSECVALALPAQP